MAPNVRLGKPHIDKDVPISDVRFDDRILWIELEDGRVIGAPLKWFPRLEDATPEQRSHYELSQRIGGIHWPEIDDDISVRVLMNHPS